MAYLVSLLARKRGMLAAVLLGVWLLPALAAAQNAEAPADPNAPAAATAAAGDSWPTYPLSGNEITRGPGWYLSLWKFLLVFFAFLIWVRATDWVGRDTNEVGLRYDIWNAVAFFPFFATLLLFFLIPWFWLGYPLLLIALAAPTVVYVLKRNALVAEADKVFTKDHLIHWLVTGGGLFSPKISTEKKLAHEKGAQVNFSALGAANEQKNQANLIEARQSPSYVVLKELVADAYDKRAEKVLLDYTAETVAIKYQIDGVWLDVPPQAPQGWAKRAGVGPTKRNEPLNLREVFDPVAIVVKKLANLNVTDRRGKQDGAFGAEYNGNKLICSLACQGTPAGERVIITLAGKAQKVGTLEELGMREKMREQLKEVMSNRSGVIIFSALPQGGLSYTMTAAMKATDRLLRDFVAVGEKSAKHEPEVENVEVHTYDAAAGESAAALINKLVLKQPDALIVRDLSDGATLKVLLAQCDDDHPKLSIATLRAKDAPEAIVRLLALKVPANEVAPKLLGSVSQRLLRKLCDKCKEAYEPPADLLTRLGIPAGRVQMLYRERQPLPPDSKEKWVPCPQCNDIGYFGRTSVFELLVVTDKLREAMVKDPKLETLKKVARAGGHRGLQEEGIALVALGITSLTELQRVMK